MDIDTTLKNYAYLMQSIKTRHAILVDVIQKKRDIPPWAIAELCQLQIRLICELFALACLVAHGDVKGANSARLTTAYQADFIIKSLEKLHPSFYPKPTRQMPQSTNSFIHLENIEDGYLTKKELLKSYHATGRFLHIGSLQDISKKQKLFDFAAAMTWANKVVLLLNHHNIPLADDPKAKRSAPMARGRDGTLLPSRMIVFMMQGEDGLPHASLFELKGAAFGHA